jgi:2-polyprenyl-3-methyl-5-hydroxy-6-metoxy-1,4-benzoquinol methylase
MFSDASNVVLGLPSAYQVRETPEYFDDTSQRDSVVVHQPEVYFLAEYLLDVDQRDILIDIGCGSGRKISTDRKFTIIGVDCCANLRTFAKRHRDALCVEANLEQSDFEFAELIDWNRAVVVCANVIEHLRNPINLLNKLAGYAKAGATVLVSTPDRSRLYELGNIGPPENLTRAQEWSAEEFVALLARNELPVAFFGHTVSDNLSKRKLTSLVIVDKRAAPSRRYPSLPETKAPLGIITAYNEEDIIEQVCDFHLGQGLDLHLVDNWSDDDTYAIMLSVMRRHEGRVRVERFPAAGPANEYKWAELLDHKASIAAKEKGRWVLHIDSDELRLSPWNDLSLREALFLASSEGFNCVDFCVVDFLPTTNGFARGSDPLSFFQFFDFARHPAHFIQRRAWVQPDEPVDLSSSGGHVAGFPGVRTFPYRFPLFHYPIRSQAQGKRKIFTDRQARYSRQEREERGWHNHYDRITPSERFLGVPELLNRYEPLSFLDNYIAEVLGDVVRRRVQGRLIFD